MANVGHKKETLFSSHTSSHYEGWPTHFCYTEGVLSDGVHEGLALRVGRVRKELTKEQSCLLLRCQAEEELLVYPSWSQQRWA